MSECEKNTIHQCSICFVVGIIRLVTLIAMNGVSVIVGLVPCFSLLTFENGLEKHARKATEK